MMGILNIYSWDSIHFSNSIQVLWNLKLRGLSDSVDGSRLLPFWVTGIIFLQPSAAPGIISVHFQRSLRKLVYDRAIVILEAVRECTEISENCGLLRGWS